MLTLLLSVILVLLLSMNILFILSFLLVLWLVLSQTSFWRSGVISFLGIVRQAVTDAEP